MTANVRPPTGRLGRLEWAFEPDGSELAFVEQEHYFAAAIRVHSRGLVEIDGVKITPSQLQQILDKARCAQEKNK